jgi:hypothetical protein
MTKEEIEIAVNDALTDLSSVQFIDNTWKEADEARAKVVEIIRALAARLTA